ncbi:unnamed protein product [Prunus brigantina]
MGSSSETGGAWSMMEDVSFCEAWLQVSHCPRFQIIPTDPTVVLNKMPLHETPASDSPMDSPMSQVSPIKKEPRPIGRKKAKEKRGSNSTKNASKFLEELSKLQAMRIEMDMKQQEHDRAIDVEYAKEREYITPVLVDCIIDLICDIWAFTSQNIIEHRGLTQDVQIVLRAGNSKEGVPNPCIKTSNCFEDDAFLPFPIAIIPLPSSWTIFPLSVHAVNATNHSRKSTRLSFL